MHKPLVSVIMPNYNTKPRYLIEAIQSILNQTYKNFEFIIVDDGSSVDNKSLIRMFKDERIKIVENATNMGLPYSLNKALHVAKGKYIFRMDADDISCTNRLEVGVEFMEKNHAADIVGSFVRQVGAKHRTLKFPLDDNHIRATLVFGSPFVHPSIIFRAEKLKKNKIEYPMDAKSEDFNLWVADRKSVVVGKVVGMGGGRVV